MSYYVAADLQPTLEAALQVFLREARGFSEQAILQVQATTQWGRWLTLAATTPYDARITGPCVLPEHQLAMLQTPTLALQGGVSASWMRAGMQALSKALPRGQLVVLPEQEHAAIREALQLLASELIRFLRILD